MPIIADTHMHSSFSGDSDAPLEDMIKQAIKLGLKEICFTEHMDYDFIYLENEPDDYFILDTAAYREKLFELKESYSDRIRVNFGVELGMQDHLHEKNREYAESYPFDFIIASSHLAHRLDPYLPHFWEGRAEKDAWHDYFLQIYEVVSSYNSFDVYGHLDYALRYGPTKNTQFVFDEYKEDIDKILKQIIYMGKGIEANTSGYHYGMGGPHPCREILTRYKELGGEILTVGSDAHKPEDMAWHFKEAEKLLKDIGFKQLCIFHGHKPEFYDI